VAKVKKWIEKKAAQPEADYEEAKREFEMAMGTPFITVRVEIPEGFEDLRQQFLNLEKNKDFLCEVKDLIKKRLHYDRLGLKKT